MHGDASGTPAGDDDLVARLRERDEAAFMFLVERYHAALVRLARRYVSDQEAAEEVAQEAWLGVLNGIDRFEGRSGLKTWLFAILIHQAMRRAFHDHRGEVPFSVLADEEVSGDEAAVEDDRFHRFLFLRGHWRRTPDEWGATPEELALLAETRSVVDGAIQALPAAQSTVITLRDVQGWTSAEVSNLLGISMANQRVLLHRGRAKVRRALESHLGEA